MQCCAQAILARSRSFLTAGSVAEHVCALSSRDFSRSNATEATGTSLDPHGAPSSPSKAAASVNSDVQAAPTTGTHAIPQHSDAPVLPTPPAQWHKRGAWIDPSHIEKRMFAEDTEKTAAANKEPETEVTKSVAALIRVRFLPPCSECEHLYSYSLGHQVPWGLVFPAVLLHFCRVTRGKC